MDAAYSAGFGGSVRSIRYDVLKPRLPRLPASLVIRSHDHIQQPTNPYGNTDNQPTHGNGQLVELKTLIPSLQLEICAI